MSDERFIHWSPKPIALVKSYAKQAHGTDFKPHGLWFSVGDGDDSWRSWAISNEFNLANLKLAYQIKFRPDAKLLWLRNAADIDNFSREYGDVLHPGLSTRGIQWRLVSDKYDAIIIAPYCHERRLSRDMLWYYGWDCASGCVWDVDAIESIAEIKLEEKVSA